MNHFILFYFVFLGPHPQPMEVPRLGGESELQLPACTTATATQDPNRVCDLYHSPWQGQILNPLSRARDPTCALTDTSQICFRWAMAGTPENEPFSSTHQWHFRHSHCCATITAVKFQNIFISPKEILSPSRNPSLYPSPQPWASTNLHSVSIVALPILDSYIKSYTTWPFVSGFFHLAYSFQDLSMS